MPTSTKREDKVSQRDPGDENGGDLDEELFRETLVNLGAAKKYQKWLSFVKPRMVLGFDKIPKEIQPEMASRPRGLALCFEKMQGWTIPNQLLEDMDVKGYQVSVQLSLSMFHTVSRTFFGSTWMGVSIPLMESDRDNLAAVVDFDYNDLVYMISRLQDQTCVAVIEIVASTIDTKNDVLVSQHGCGWTMLALFANQFTDISQGYDEGKEMSSTIYAGSPRDLIMKRDALDSLREINGCALHYRVFESWKLLKAQNLVAENAVLGRFEVIAGLQVKAVTFPDEVRKRRVACIGDHEEMVGKQGVRIVPCVPQLAPTMTLSLIDWHLLVPGRARFESRVRVKTTTQMQLQHAAESQIISRVLKIGLHNGHTLINKDNEWLRIPLDEDEGDKDVLLLPADRSTIALDGYVAHENVALVFLVEYEVGIFKPQATQYDVHSTIDAIFGEKDMLRTAVTIGATAHIPFDGRHFQLKNIDEENQDSNDEELNMELELLPNQLCQVLSQNLIFSDEDHRRLVASAKAKVASKGLASAAGEDENANDNPVIGFDLKVFNKKKKEFFHMQTLDDVGSDDESDDESEVSRRGKRSSHRPPRDKPGRFIKSDTPRRDEDAVSVISEPSLVGGSSEASSLRLDPSYYMSTSAQPPPMVTEPVTYQPNLQLPTGRQSSLLARSMETRLGGSKKLVRKNRDDEILRESRSRFKEQSVLSDESQGEGGIIRHVYSRSPHVSQQAFDFSARADVKDLSRAARARLSRHGFNDAIADSGNLQHPTPHMGRALQSQQRHDVSMAVDIEAEAKDELNVHEINIQFAGYRVGYPRQHDDKAKPVRPNVAPRCVYFSFQFFTCRPTRTEIMRLLPSSSANSDEFSILVRDEANSSRNEAPLVLRYIINSSEVSPLEAVEFAEYLAHGTLFVDVWDADSLLHIGTMGLPLSRLMRQGKPVAKAGLESNVINSESSLRADRGGVYTTVITDGAAPAGTVVGAVNVLLANYGQKGPSAIESKDSKKSGDCHFTGHQPVEGLNWRAVDEDRHKPSSRHRPKISVRAKPLTESAPELNKALKEHRLDDGKYSNRSLSTLRGNEGVHTLTYDDIMILFKRFQGSVKGTIQYSGQLMKLLDLPNSSQSILKFFKLHKICLAKRLDMKQLLIQYADGKGQLTAPDFKEFLRDTFEKFSISSTIDENNIITHRVYTSHSREGGRGKTTEPARVLDADQIISFCISETARQDWVVISRRLLRTVQKAYLANVDVEQELAEKDEEGKHTISVSSFQSFLKELSRYGKLRSHDIEVIVKHFRRKDSSSANAISLREFAAFLGKRYDGNIKARFRAVLCRPHDEGKEMTTETILTLSGAKGMKEADGVTMQVKEMCNTVVSYNEIDERLQKLNIFGEFTHEQVRRLLTQVTGSAKGISIVELVNYLGISHNLEAKSKRPETKKYADMSAEELLNILVEKSRSDDGVSFDQTFRYFDADGDGSISVQELETGIDKLQVFDNIPNWRKQISKIARKFDPDGDGQISLKEFFAYFGCQEYIPNTIQRLTRIFATANIPLRNIFGEFDADGSGYLTATELKNALKGIGGTFEELTQADVESIVAHFDTDGDGKTSQDEFITFFDARVENAKHVRKVKARQRFQRRFKLVLMSVVNDGGTLEQIFQHFNKDDDGAISRQELVEGLKSMSHFKNFAQEEFDSLLAILDSNNDGSISFQEFKRFVTDAGKPDPEPEIDERKISPRSKEDKSRAIIERLHKIVKTAEKKGTSPDLVFGHLDKNRDGAVTIKELQTGLKKIPFFSKLTNEDYVDLFYALDEDDSGEISIKEFIDVVVRGELPRKKNVPSLQLPQDNEVKDDRGDMKFSHIDKKALFIRLVQNIARSEDGGITGMMAYLDHDEDGLVSLTMLLRYFRREEMFGNSRDREKDRGDQLDEKDVEDILDPITRKDGFVRVDALMSLLKADGDSREVLPSSVCASDDEDEGDEVFRSPDDEYQFSKDPETLVLEKKLRQLGVMLAKKGMNIEGVFRDYDMRYSGMVRRTELLEILSKLGLYILEKGASGQDASIGDHDSDYLARKQQKQVSRIKQGGRGGEYVDNAIKMASRLTNMNPTHSMHGGDFKDHMESMAMINWYRQGQKRMLLQRVLSHSLASVIHLYPRFGKTLFFEFPLSNPFGHEERFLIEISDPELRIVTSFDEWANLRATCRPCHGTIGDEPVEAEMFDADMAGNVQVALLPQETLSIPFSYITFEPYFQPSNLEKSSRKFASRSGNGRAGESKDDDDSPSEVVTTRVVNVRIISGSHGHVISVIKVHIHPRPFVVNRSITFYEPENTVMKRRIRLTGQQDRRSHVPGMYNAASKYVHCVETATGGHGHVLGADGGGNQVLVEWGESDEGLGNLDLIVRYRCLEFPHVGSFYVILYNDPHQCSLHEIWQLTVHTRQKLDLHCTLGNATSLDLVVRGDRFARRSRAWHSPPSLGGGATGVDQVSLRPDIPFQLVPGAYNRVMLSYLARSLGAGRIQVNVVDVDTRELISAWLLFTTAAAPAIMRSYDVDVTTSRPTQKKIIFKNPWDMSRKFVLVSSNEDVMRPRAEVLDVAGQGSVYLKLWFNRGVLDAPPQDVYLFLNDPSGRTEECFLFQVFTTK